MATGWSLILYSRPNLEESIWDGGEDKEWSGPCNCFPVNTPDFAQGTPGYILSSFSSSLSSLLPYLPSFHFTEIQSRWRPAPTNTHLMAKQGQQLPSLQLPEVNWLLRIILVSLTSPFVTLREMRPITVASTINLASPPRTGDI